MKRLMLRYDNAFVENKKLIIEWLDALILVNAMYITSYELINNLKY